MYEVYYNKQQPNAVIQSPQTNLGFTQTPNTSSGLSISQGIGIGVAAAKIIPAGKQVFNTVLQATGDKQLQRNVESVNSLIGFGITAATLGPLAAVGVGVLNMGVKVIQEAIQEDINITNQNYVIQKRGVAIDKFVGVGERID